MRLPTRMLFFCASLVAATIASAADLAWGSDLEAAKAKAKEAGLPVLLEFTGSDWCPNCIQLHKEVVPTAEFEAFAAKHVLVSIDFPKRSERTPEKIAADPGLKARMALKDAYKIEGFPTWIVLSPDGKETARMLGYDGGGFAGVSKALAGGKP